MVEAVMFWNEPNNKSHWDFEIDPEWRHFAEMVKLAAALWPSGTRPRAFSAAFRPSILILSAT